MVSVAAHFPAAGQQAWTRRGLLQVNTLLWFRVSNTPGLQVTVLLMRVVMEK